MIRKIQYITFCLSAIVGVAQTSSLKFDFHTGELSQTLLSEDIDSITFSHGIDTIESVWDYSQTSGNTTSWITTGSQVVNDMTLKDGKLYVVRRNGSNDDNTIEIVNAYLGVKIGSLNTDSCNTGAHYISAIETLGNSIIACNLTVEGNFIIYKWDDDTSEPEVMLNAPAPCDRIGDAMSVSGDMENGRIWFVYDSNVYYYTVNDGIITSTTPTAINLTKDGYPYWSKGYHFTTYSNVTVEDDGTFWISPRGSSGYEGLPVLFTADGVFVKEFPDLFPQVAGSRQGTDLKFITFNGKRYGIASTYLSTTGGSLSNGAILMVDMSVSADTTYILPPLGLGGTRNTSFRNSICTEVNDDGCYMWVNIPFQGAACYKMGWSEAVYETIWTKLGGLINHVKVDDSILFRSKELTDEYGITIGAEVDLGLSVNWSGWDLGATSTRGNGAHFAWGEILPRTKDFTLEGYLLPGNDANYSFIGEEISGTGYDAARYHLGDGWRMPTKAEADELLQNCTWELIVCNNIIGYKVIGPNGNSIFIPLNGHKVYDALKDNGTHCCYWTGTLVMNSDVSRDNANANVLLYGPESKKTETVIDNRRWGHCIRPVKSKK